MAIFSLVRALFFTRDLCNQAVAAKQRTLVHCNLACVVFCMSHQSSTHINRIVFQVSGARIAQARFAVPLQSLGMKQNFDRTTSHMLEALQDLVKSVVVLLE